MIGVNDGFMCVSHKIGSPCLQRMYDCEQFFVVNVPIVLHCVQSLGKESDGVELAFFTPLLKDSANCISGGIAINNKGVFETWLSQDQGCANCIYKGLESGFVFTVPMEMATLGAMCHKSIEGCR